MNELQANQYIQRIERQGQSEQRLVVRILHATEDDKLKTAKILQAVEIYIDEFKRPIHSRKERNSNHQRRPSSPNPARKLKQTINHPSRALDNYVAGKKKIATRKAKVWARDNLARPVVAAALRVVGMEMKR